MTYPQTRAQPFQNIPASIATYPYTDIQEGTGFVDFKGFKFAVSGSATYAITSNSPYSNYHPNQLTDYQGIDTQIGTGAAADVLLKTMDFDLSAFNFPQEIGGTAILNVPFSGKSSPTASGVYIRFLIQKWNGATATTLGSAEIEPITFSGTTIYPGVLCIPVVIPKTQFTPGEILRVEIKVYDNGNGAGTVSIGHDPQNRASTYFVAGNSTIFHAYIPFKIDI